MVSVRFCLRSVAALLALGLISLGLYAERAEAQHGQPGAQQQTQPAPPQPQLPAAPAEPSPAATPAAPPAQAQPAAPAAPVLSTSEQQSLDELRQPIMELRGLLETLEGSVEQNKQNDGELARIRAELVDLVQKAQSRLSNLKEKTTALRQQFEKLKPAPPAEGGETAAPESEQVAAERARVGAMLSEVDGAQKTGELVQVRARQLQTDVQKLRQDIFTQELLYRSPSLLKPETWTKLGLDFPGAWRQVADVTSTWLSAAAGQWIAVIGLFIGALLFYIAVKMLVRRFISYQLDAPRIDHPGFVEQAATIGWVAPLSALPAIGSIGVLAAGLDALGLLELDIAPIAQQAFIALAVFSAVRALTHAVLQPRRPDWRLIDVETPVARRLTRIVTGIAFVFSFDYILQELIRRLYLPLSINAAETVFASVIIAFLLLALVSTPFGAKERSEHESDVHLGEGGQLAPPAPPTAADLTPEFENGSSARQLLIKIPALGAAAAILVTSALGYVGLARLITSHVVLTGGAIAVVVVIHLAIRSLLQGPVRTLLEVRFGVGPAQSSALRRVMSIVLNVTLALIAIPLVLVSWGYTTQEALGWLRAALFGFEIGEVRISPARILFAIGLFLALIFATRLTQRWLDSGVLRSVRVDQGIANSIRTAVGYTGFIVAVLAAVSYGGLDITNFAIVAGALSVGIGFGLQSIVNNFVSGLILLVERPIKVGDRIAVKGQEGFVRRISVRSTEIETGDRASLIVPNSELITSSVTNWTHRNSLGTASVQVTVSYREDPERVREILQKVGSECTLILQHPAPGVSLDNLAPNGIVFSLGGVVSDVTKAGAAQTDLRFRILKAFREAGIEIPYSQHDVHLRDLDAVRSVLARLADERARANGSNVEPDPDRTG